jgi:hypothetical protein
MENIFLVRIKTDKITLIIIIGGRLELIPTLFVNAKGGVQDGFGCDPNDNV